MPEQGAVCYWHGGQAELKAGSLILPPSETGARNMLREFGTGQVSRADRVYVTTRREGALLYAAMHPSKGWVYEVEPIGMLEPDPDCREPGLSWSSARALIVSAQPLSRKTREGIIEALFGGVAP